MPVTVNHALTATTPDNTSYEIRPIAHWNATHAVSLNAVGSEVSGAFSNSNGVSFGLEGGGHITASIAVGIGALAAGTQTATSGTQVFSNSNNVSFGLSNSSVVTASASFPAQTNQSIGVYGLSQTTGASSSSTVDARSLSFVGAGNVSVGLTNGSVVISATGGGGGAAASVGVSTGGNTLGNTGTQSGQVVLVGGNNVTLSVATAAGGAQTITISGANAGGAQTGISSVIVSNTTYTSGAISFSNANGISFGSSAGQAITASYTVPTQTNQSAGIYASSQTYGQSSSSTHDARSLTVVGSGGVSVGWSNSSLLISGQTTTPQTNQSMGIYASSNTTGASSSSTFDARSLTIQGLGCVSLGWSNGSLQVSGPTTAVLSQLSAGISGGNTAGGTGTVAQGQIVFAGGANITLSGSVNGSSATVSIVGGAGGGIANSAGTQLATSGTVIFSNSNGVSFGMSNSSVITASVSIQTEAIYGSSQTFGQSSSSTYNPQSLSIYGSGGVSVGWSNGSLGISGQTTTPQTNQTVGLYASSQTTGQSSSSTADARSVTFVGAGGVSVGLSAGSYIISGAAGGGGGVLTVTGANGSSVGASTLAFSNSNGMTLGVSTAANGATVTGSYTQAAQTNQTAGLYASSQTFGQSSSSTHDARSLTIYGSGGVSVGWSNGSLGISGITTAAQTNQTIGLYALGNTTQNSSSTMDARTLSFNALGAMTMGYSNGSIQVSAPGTSSLVGVGGISISTNGSTISISEAPISRLIYPLGNLTAISAPGNASATLQYVPVMQPVTLTRLDALVSWVGASSATTNTCAFAVSAYAAIYTKNGATLSSVSSGSTQTTYSYASNSAGQTQLITGAIRPISVPINANMTPGEYYVGFNIVTATSSIGLSTTNLVQSLSMMGGNQLQTAANFAEFTNQTATSTNQYGGMGVYSAATTGLPAAVSLSAINQTGAALSQANIALAFRNQ